jgi:hypothetical protein
MRSRIRTVMMWLLIAALPVQSWAVATMVNCSPSHHRMAASASNGVDHQAHGHDGALMPGHDHASHHHVAVSDSHADEVAPSDAAEPGNDAKPPLSLAKFKCSACATCCLGMALPSSMVTFDASVSSDTVEPGMPHGHVVFLTAGLERPPRSILA